MCNIQKLHLYLYGKHFDVVVDHKVLKKLFLDQILKSAQKFLGGNLNDKDIVLLSNTEKVKST